MVLDEPNSNLDAEGEAALTAAIENVRARGGIVTVIAHRPSALEAVNYVGVIQAGKLTGFGPKDEIIRPPSQARPQQGPQAQPQVKPIKFPGTAAGQQT